MPPVSNGRWFYYAQSCDITTGKEAPSAQILRVVEAVVLQSEARL